MLLEVQLTPYKFRGKFPGHHVKIIEDCLAPHRDMVKGAITIRARRLDKHIWEAWHTPLRWWQRAPKVEWLDRPLHWKVDKTHYRFARQVEILATDFFMTRGSLGPDVRVLAFSQIDKGRDGHRQINCYVRKVLYVRADDPKAGITPDPNAIALPGGPPGPGNIAAVAQHHAAYLAELDGKERGLMFHPHTHRWVDPAQYAAEQKYEDEQREFRRRAGC